MYRVSFSDMNHSTQVLSTRFLSDWRGARVILQSTKIDSLIGVSYLVIFEKLKVLIFKHPVPFVLLK